MSDGEQVRTGTTQESTQRSAPSIYGRAVRLALTGAELAYLGAVALDRLKLKTIIVEVALIAVLVLWNTDSVSNVAASV